MMRINSKLVITLIAFVTLTGAVSDQKKGKTLQFNISAILNARPVTVIHNNRLTPWRKGIDGGGLADGYMTLSAAKLNGDKAPHALPDNPLFAATASHPPILLHYGNEDTLKQQACVISNEREVQFPTPAGNYMAVYLALTSAEGESSIKVTFNYADGAITRSFIVPDYYQDLPAADTDFCYLAHDLAKWGIKNNMTERNHHNIDLLNVHPAPSKTLISIRISKSKPGYLVLWAATGTKVD